MFLVNVLLLLYCIILPVFGIFPCYISCHFNWVN
jgi:hypothetical protein